MGRAEEETGVCRGGAPEAGESIHVGGQGNSKPSWVYCITVQKEIKAELVCQTPSIRTELGNVSLNWYAKLSLKELFGD